MKIELISRQNRRKASKLNRRKVKIDYFWGHLIGIIFITVSNYLKNKEENDLEGETFAPAHWPQIQNLARLGFALFPTSNIGWNMNPNNLMTGMSVITA